ncbi:hypothetical protein COB11_03155 [Candidatus Aerophobetes bacterium]|uniref:Alpha-1,2-fucosyltransferase n=1 Tax=Aerophobetes bacterium TaxID=2030807 RepID=A0A2A4YKX2_UNCAE|nr:MAG: hypothetical protein COB11_03155 [Candidatus Aerophobetes bacterium]
MKDLLAHPKTVAVHFRHYFDTRPEYHPTLRNSYYRKCFAKFDKEHLFVIFSNDIKRAKIYFSRFRVKYNILFIENSPHLDDFYLMSLCKHNIIANSSFSWWSAYLNMNPKKRVLTPSNKHWFGPAYKNYNTEDLLPDEWEKVF